MFIWDGNELHRSIEQASPPTGILAADSWLVTDGRVLALDLHRDRFFSAARHQLIADPEARDRLNLEHFWEAAIASSPRHSSQFPRVELQQHAGGTRLVAWQRPAPALTLSLTVATHDGEDPRTQPLVKGPDTVSLLQARLAAQKRGADEAVLLSPDGFIAEGAYSAILWWRGQVLCAPTPELEKINSVTARSVIALATAMGVDLDYEAVAPEELDGREVWALSALHGIRIVTAWIDGPALAEEPGRLALWRARLARLRKPLPDAHGGTSVV